MKFSAKILLPLLFLIIFFFALFLLFTPSLIHPAFLQVVVVLVLLFFALLWFIGFKKIVIELKEKEKLRSVLDKVLSKDIAEKILESTLDLGGEECMVTMLFSDIRDFTTFTEHFSAQKTIEVLNLYMTKMSRIIENEGGIIDKYVGDEIMALFGTPVPHPQHALRAISTGMLMIERIKGMNEERIKLNEPIFNMGIGIHTGIVVAGNMGAENRLNFTVIGKNVNLAARLCQSAKPGQLIISEKTLEEPGVKESFVVNSLPPISLKGFSEKINIYEITGFRWG